MFTRLRKASYRIRGYCPANLAGEPFHCDPYHSKFWRLASTGQWEPELFSVLSAHLPPDHDYLDIGAWIGPSVLFGARKARHVWCFEPDPNAYRHLAMNIDLNGLTNVSAFQVALGNRFSIAQISSFGGESGDSMTSLLCSDANTATDVLTIGWDQFEQSCDLSAVSLVKMDIEGAEFDILPDLIPLLKRRRPALYLSLHPPFLDPDERSGKLRTLIDALGFYDRCQDGRGTLIDRTHIPTDRFSTFLFS